MERERLLELAEAVKMLCVETAEEAYEQASISGLCGSGAWEVAQGAVKTLDMDAFVEQFLRSNS